MSVAPCFSVFILDIVFGGGNFPSPKKLTIPRPQIVCSKSFFRPGHAVSYRYIPETFFWWTIKTGIVVITQSKGCKFMPKITHQIRLAAGLCPHPLGELMCSPKLPSCNGEPTSKRRQGPTYKVMEGTGRGLRLRRAEGGERHGKCGGRELPSKVKKVSRINTAVSSP